MEIIKQFNLFLFIYKYFSQIAQISNMLNVHMVMHWYI